MRIFVIFDLDLHSQVFLLQELYGGPHCDQFRCKFDENRLNCDRDIKGIFYYFPMTYCPPGKGRLICASNDAKHFFNRPRVS